MWTRAGRLSPAVLALPRCVATSRGVTVVRVNQCVLAPACESVCVCVRARARACVVLACESVCERVCVQMMSAVPRKSEMIGVT